MYGADKHFLEIDGHTAVAGVIGYPVRHTLSPLIHNTLSGIAGINMAYVPFEVAPSDVGAAVQGAYALGMLGLNVTVPHKQAVMPYLVRVEEEATLIGAVNTLVRDKGGYAGYNTDLNGLYRAMASEGVFVEGQDVILLGAGGAAHAAAFLCALRGANQVYLLNRSVEKARLLADAANRACLDGGNKACVIPLPLSQWRSLPAKRYLAIQATSVGLAPHDNEAVIEDPAFYAMIHTGFDMVYRPADTKFMRLLREAGGQAYNGLKMLLYQGVESFEHWNGIRMEEEAVMLCYERMKEEVEHA